MSRYSLEILISGKDNGATATVKSVTESMHKLQLSIQTTARSMVTLEQASIAKTIAPVAKSFREAEKEVSRFGQSLHEIARVAAGVLLRDAIRGLYNLILDIAGAALTGYMNFEKLTTALTALITKQLAMGQTAEIAHTSIYQLTQADIDALAALGSEYELLGAKIAYLQESLAKATDMYGANSFQALTLAAALREAQGEYDALGARIEALQNKNGALITTIEEVTVGQMSQNKAMELAIPLAEQLALWIETLSLTRPLFSEEVTANALQLAGAFNFTLIYAMGLSDELARLKQAQADGVVTAQRLVLALQDFISASGFGGDVLERLITALGQVQAKGKLAAEEVRQFVNAGLGLDTMARAMGMSISDFSAALAQGKIDAETFILAIVELFESDFAGAAESFSSKLVGIKQGFANLVTILGRRTVSPFLEALLPLLQELYEYMSSEAFRLAISEWAENAAVNFTLFMESARVAVERVIKYFQAFSDGNLTTKELVIGVGRVIFPDIVDKVQAAIDEFVKIITPLIDLDLGFEDNISALGTFAKAIVIYLTSSVVLGAIAGILGLFGSLASAIGFIGLAFAGLVTAWEENWMGLRDTLQRYYDELKPIIDKFLLLLTEDFYTALSDLKGIFYGESSKSNDNTFIGEMARDLENISNYNFESTGDLIDFIEDLYTFDYGEGGKQVEEAFDAIIDFIIRLAETANPLGVVLIGLPELITSFDEALLKLITDLESISANAEESTPVTNIITGIAEALIPLYDILQNAEWQELERIFTLIGDLANLSLDGFSGPFIVLGEFLQTVLEQAEPAILLLDQIADIIGKNLPQSAEGIKAINLGFYIMYDLIMQLGEAFVSFGKTWQVVAMETLRRLADIFSGATGIIFKGLELKLLAIIEDLQIMATFFDDVKLAIDNVRDAITLLATDPNNGNIFNNIISAAQALHDLLVKILEMLFAIQVTPTGNWGNSGGQGTGGNTGGSAGGGGGGGGGNYANSPIVGTMIVNNPAAASVVMQQLRNARTARNIALVR